MPRGVAVHYEGDGLTPGRRRAAQIIQEVKEQLEQDIANLSSSTPLASTSNLPKAPTFSLFFDAMPSVDFTSGDDEAMIYRLKQHFEHQLKRRQDLNNEASAKRNCF